MSCPLLLLLLSALVTCHSTGCPLGSILSYTPPSLSFAANKVHPICGQNWPRTAYSQVLGILCRCCRFCIRCCMVLLEQKATVFKHVQSGIRLGPSHAVGVRPRLGAGLVPWDHSALARMWPCHQPWHRSRSTDPGLWPRPWPGPICAFRRRAHFPL